VHFEAIIPRLSDKKWVRPYKIRPRTPWSVPVSLFKDYEIETEEKVAECFETDWSMMRLPPMDQ
jgi:hypothetical protein